MERMNYKTIKITHAEDVIRRQQIDKTNILTGIFKKGEDHGIQG